MVTKLDIMNNRKDETWEIVNGKVQRVEKEKQKVTGPTVENAITHVEIKEKVFPKRTEMVITEKKEVKKKSKKK